MNKKFYNTIKLLTLLLAFLLASNIANKKISAGCIGEITCAYTYSVSHCSGGPNDGNSCTNGDDHCDGSLCLEDGTNTQYDNQNCSAPIGQCTAGSASCTSPYEQTPDSGTCSESNPTPPPPNATPTPPPPPAGCDTPGWCGECTCPEGDPMGRAVFIFFEDKNKNGIWDYDATGPDREPRIHPNEDHIVNNTISVPGAKLYMNGSNMGVTSNILNEEYLGPTRCTRESHPSHAPEKTCKDWTLTPNAQSIWDETCLAEPITCSKVHCNPNGECWDCQPSDSEQGGLCDLAGGAYCATDGPADLRHGDIYYYKDHIGTKVMTIIPPSGWIISPGTNTQLNIYNSNQFNINVTTSGNQVTCNAGLTAIGIVQDYNKKCTIVLSETSIAKNQNPPEYTTAEIYGYSEMTGTEPTRLWLANADSNSPILDEFGQPFTPEGTVFNSSLNYYEYTPDGDCTTGDSTACNEDTVISDLPVGNYRLWCDVPTPEQACSGNPDCTINNGPTDCGPDWASCSTQDNINLEVYCTHSCTEDCNTGITLGETPGQVTNVNVTGLSNNNKDLTTSSTVEITWTESAIPDPATINGYDVWILPQSPPQTLDATSICTGDCYAVPNTTNSTNTSITYTPQPGQTNNVSIFVRGKNTEPDCPINGAWSNLLDVNYVAQVSGTIYDLSDGPDASNNCINTADTITIDISAGFTSMISSTGGSISPKNTPGTTYTMNDIPYAPSSWWTPDNDFDLTLNLSSADPANTFYCSCPGSSDPFSCAQTSTATDGTPQNFFVSAVNLENGPWWQNSEGNVYGSSGYLNPIPDACDASATCNANMIIQNIDSDIKSAGIPMSGGSISAGGYFTEYNFGDANPIQPRSANTSHANLVKEDYNYFIRNINLESVEEINGTINTLPTLGTGTTYNDAEVFYLDGNLTADFNTLQTVGTGTKTVILVSGDITFGNPSTVQQLIEVENGGFIAFIAGGDITFSNDIGNACEYLTGCDSTDTNIEGVFVASRYLIFADDSADASPDNMFVGEGTFVGWNGIYLNRSFDNTDAPLDRALNNEYPTELFKFRPDFNENIPEILKHPNLVWQEVN